MYAGEGMKTGRMVNVQNAAESTFTEWKASTGTPDANSIYQAPGFSNQGITTVDANSDSGQKVLNVTSTTGFSVGDIVWIGDKTSRQEKKTIDTIQAGISLTMTANLSSTHTAAQADSVFSSVYTSLALQSASACKNAGQDLRATVAADYASNTRDATPDIGAYEYI
jgi:hypothetical protein